MPREGSVAKIRALIVDDEAPARANIRVLLRRDPDIDSIAECESGALAAEEILRTNPDLVFLDIQMPECDGFDVLELLGSKLPPALVFVTAHDEFALRAFEAGVLDYLLKPFDDTRFHVAMGRAKEKLAQVRSAPGPSAPRLTVRSAGRVSFVALSEIDWIESADYYACLHLGAKSHLLRRSLHELERQLDSQQFCRVHRTAIVNLDRVRGLEVGEGGEYQVLLDSGQKLKMSRRYRKGLQLRLGMRSLRCAP